MAALTLTLALQSLAVATALYFITGYLLRLLFSPKRLPLPPGPKGWPVVGSLPLLGATPHIALMNLAKKHGPMLYLRLGTCDTVVASNREVARAILKDLDQKVCGRPLGAGPTYIAYNAEDMVFAQFGPRWKLLRKLSNLHLFGTTALSDSIQMRRKEIGFMVRDVCKLANQRKPVPILKLISCALANMIGQMCISQRVFEGHGEESGDFKEMITELMRLAGLFNIGDFIPAIEWMDLQGIQAKMKTLHAKFDKQITRMLEEHLATTADRKDNPDFFDHLMGAKEEEVGVKLEMINYKAVLLNMFIAGTDTSSCTIEWAMAEVLKNPRILKKLRDEIDQVVGKDRRLEESDIAKLPYLHAITRETFRKHPVTVLSIPRKTTEPCEVNGYYIPKETRLLINYYSIGRDPEVWKDPLEFRPERFLEEHAGVEPWGKHYELIPFGAGRRICAGIRMGMITVPYVVGLLVHAFDWEVDGEVDLDETFGLVLVKAKKLEAIAKPRLNPSAYMDIK